MANDLVIHQSDAAVFYKGRGIRSSRNKQRWVQLVVRTDTGLPCLNICKLGETHRVKETVALFKDNTRVSTPYVRKETQAKVQVGKGDYVFTITTTSLDVDREYSFKVASLLQLEQWMAQLKQAIFSNKNWFSCQQRIAASNIDTDILLDVNVSTCHMIIIDPLGSTHESTGLAHNLLKLTEFGAERDYITLYFTKCAKCERGEEVFLRTSRDNVNKILGRVQEAIELALGTACVERIVSSKCGYNVFHTCEVLPPTLSRRPMEVPSTRPRPVLPDDLRLDIHKTPLLSQRLPRPMPTPPTQPRPMIPVSTPTPGRVGPYQQSPAHNPNLRTPPVQRHTSNSGSGGGSTGSTAQSPRLHQRPIQAHQPAHSDNAFFSDGGRTPPPPSNPPPVRDTVRNGPPQPPPKDRSPRIPMSPPSNNSRLPTNNASPTASRLPQTLQSSSMPHSNRSHFPPMNSLPGMGKPGRPFVPEQSSFDSLPPPPPVSEPEWQPNSLPRHRNNFR